MRLHLLRHIRLYGFQLLARVDLHMRSDQGHRWPTNRAHWWRDRRMGTLECDTQVKHWNQNKMDAILQAPFSNAFSWMKIIEFWFKCYSSLFQRVQETNLTNPKLHRLLVPQFIIQNKIVHISVLNGTLWDKGHVQCGICELAPFPKSQLLFHAVCHHEHCREGGHLGAKQGDLNITSDKIFRVDSFFSGFTETKHINLHLRDEPAHTRLLNCFGQKTQ